MDQSPPSKTLQERLDSIVDAASSPALAYAVAITYQSGLISGLESILTHGTTHTSNEIDNLKLPDE